MMQPKRTKFRKQFKGSISGSAQRGNFVAFGEFGLKATDRCRMTAREIEAARRAISRYVKRGGRIWIRVFPDVPITQKPLEVRMGSGKGNVEYWVAKVLPGKVLFEIEGLSGDEIARIQNVPTNTVWSRLYHARKEFFALAAKYRKSQRP